MTEPQCPICPFASRNGDRETGVCQNALSENYARAIAAVTSCPYVVKVKRTKGKHDGP